VNPEAGIQGALQPTVALWALAYTVIVGAIIIAINHGDAMLIGDLRGGRLARMGLTVAVPSFVSTFSSGGAIRGCRPVQESNSPCR